MEVRRYTALDAETQHLIDVRGAQIARLRVLEVQKARHGHDVQPHIEIEIETIQQALRLAEAGIRSDIPIETVKDLGPVGRFRALHKEIQELEEKDDERGTVFIERLEELANDVRSSIRFFAWWLLGITFVLFVLTVSFTWFLVTSR